MKKSLLDKIYPPLIISLGVIISCALIWPIFGKSNHNLLYGAFLIFLIILSFIRPKINVKYKKMELAIRALLIILFIIALRVWGQNIKI